MSTSECVGHIDGVDKVDEHGNLSFNDESHVSYSEDAANLLSEAADIRSTPIPTEPIPTESELLHSNSSIVASGTRVLQVAPELQVEHEHYALPDS
jgi:hypothetical protein